MKYKFVNFILFLMFAAAVACCAFGCGPKRPEPVYIVENAKSPTPCAHAIDRMEDLAYALTAHIGKMTRERDSLQCIVENLLPALNCCPAYDMGLCGGGGYYILKNPVGDTTIIAQSNSTYIKPRDTTRYHNAKHQ